MKFISNTDENEIRVQNDNSKSVNGGSKPPASVLIEAEFKDFLQEDFKIDKTVFITSIPHGLFT